MWTPREMTCKEAGITEMMFSEKMLKSKYSVITDKWGTSTGVSIFLSLILSYFCFLVPAFRPCHGRLRQDSF